MVRLCSCIRSIINKTLSQNKNIMIVEIIIIFDKKILQIDRIAGACFSCLMDVYNAYLLRIILFSSALDYNEEGIDKDFEVHCE